MRTWYTEGHRRWVGVCLLVWLGGCAQQPVAPLDPAVAHCLNLYDKLSRAAARHTDSPSSPVPVTGFPHLALDRFHVQLGQPLDDPALLQVWVGRLAALGAGVREIQLDALPAGQRAALGGDAINAALERCGTRLQALDLADPQRLTMLRAARVADDYLSSWRILGLYPLSSLPVQAGVAGYHAETRARFETPLAALPVVGELRRYRAPAGSPAVGELPRDQLDVPIPDPLQLDALFRHHAPVWEVDTVGVFDRPGTPYWRSPGVPDVDPDAPVVYRYVSYTFWQQRPVLQLNYVVWFAARPPEGRLDILAGRLDGLHWRVTLDHDGQPLIHDSIHPCGCYHMLFPTERLVAGPASQRLREPLLVPQSAPRLEVGQRLVIRIASGSHYIQRLYADRADAQVVGFRAYPDLYRVNTASGAGTSLFDAGGLVVGTERAERWILWPMGIASPGAMRERGRHPVAFVGRRHFDDPDLLGRFFQASTGPP